MSDRITCYFSFRSPYSWLAMYRLGKIIDDLPVEMDFIPVFPPPGMRTSAESDARKLAYIRQDVKRFADAYGLAVCFPDPFDVRWLIPHSAFLCAHDAGKGLVFCNALYRARFSAGNNIAKTEVIRQVANDCGLDGEIIAKAGRDKMYHERVLSGMANLSESNVFGVPTFFYNDKQYWGNDRLEWLLRDIYRERGNNVPDLEADPLSRPF